MQGFILHTQKVRDEDLLTKILTPTHLYTLYRFYGCRHSAIHLGNKIDFTIEQDLRNIGKLREPIHLSFTWEKENSKRYYWQQYLKLLNRHLKDITILDSFYFEHLEEGTKRLEKENPQRAILNLYAKLLEFEGRNNTLQACLICQNPLQEKIVLGRSMVGAHIHCMQGEVFEQAPILQWLNQRGEFLEEGDIEKLWNLLSLGL